MAKHSERLVLLESTPTEMEAGIIVAALEEAGIQATMTGAHTAGFCAEAPGWVKILVAEGDLLQARTILRDVVRENKDVDWSQVDVGEATSDESDSVPTHWIASTCILAPHCIRSNCAISHLDCRRNCRRRFCNTLPIDSKSLIGKLTEGRR